MPENLIVVLDEGQTTGMEMGEDFAGSFQMFCEVYASHEVKVQVKGKKGVWKQMYINGTAVKFTKEGDMVQIKMVRSYVYRLVTDTKGAFVSMARE